MSINSTIERYYTRTPYGSSTIFTKLFFNRALRESPRGSYKLPTGIQLGFSDLLKSYLCILPDLEPKKSLGQTFCHVLRYYGLLECKEFVIPNVNLTVVMSPVCAFIKETNDLLFWVTQVDQSEGLFITAYAVDDTSPKPILHFIRKLLIPSVKTIPIHIVDNCKILPPSTLKNTNILTTTELIEEIKDTEAVLLSLHETIRELLSKFDSSSDFASNLEDIRRILRKTYNQIQSGYCENAYLLLQTFIMKYFTTFSTEIFAILQQLLYQLKILFTLHYDNMEIKTPNNINLNLTHVNSPCLISE